MMNEQQSWFSVLSPWGDVFIISTLSVIVTCVVLWPLLKPSERQESLSKQVAICLWVVGSGSQFVGMILLTWLAPEYWIASIFLFIGIVVISFFYNEHIKVIDINVFRQKSDAPGIT